MPSQTLRLDDQYTLNHCTRYLARYNFDQLTSDDWSADICESWRFPIIDSYSDGALFEDNYAFNRVTFIYAQQGTPRSQNLAVIGTFNNLYEPLPLQPVRFQDTPTRYYALSLVVPKGEVHTYKFLLDGEERLVLLRRNEVEDRLPYLIPSRRVDLPELDEALRICLAPGDPWRARRFHRPVLLPSP